MGRNSLFSWTAQYDQYWTVKSHNIVHNLFFYQKRWPAESENNQKHLFEL